MVLKSKSNILFLAVLVVFILVFSTGVYAHQKSAADFKTHGPIVICYYWPEYDVLLLESDNIVVAKVTNKECVWGTEDKNKRSLLNRHLIFLNSKPSSPGMSIYTEYDFEPVSVLKGDISEFKGRVPGGKIDDYSLLIDDDQISSLNPGDEVLLFLNSNYYENGCYNLGDPAVFKKIDNDSFENYGYGLVTTDQLKNECGNQ